MNETPRDPEPLPGERIERHEVVERGPTDAPLTETRYATSPPPRATPMWIWVLPLVILVIVLVWFVLSRGEPRSPLDSVRDVEVGAPAVQERTIEIEAPRIELPEVSAPSVPEPSAPPAGEAPAGEAPAADPPASDGAG